MFGIVRRWFGRGVGKKDSGDNSQDEENELTEEEVHARARAIARSLMRPTKPENEGER